MEHLNLLTETSEGRSQFRIHHVKKRVGPVRLFLKQLLLANYSLSVYLNHWREELYTPMAAKITSFELFSILLSVQFIFYPKLRNQEDVMYFCFWAAIIFYLCFFYFQYRIVQLFKHFQVKRRYQQNVNDLPFRTTALIFLGSSSLIMVGFAFKAIYDYQGWFFLWHS